MVPILGRSAFVGIAFQLLQKNEADVASICDFSSILQRDKLSAAERTGADNANKILANTACFGLLGRPRFVGRAGGG
jgi:hypothetical protein